MMDKKAILISITLGFFIFFAMGLSSIGSLAFLMIYGTEMSLNNLSFYLQELLLNLAVTKVLPSFALGIVCTVMVHLMGESFVIKPFKNIRITRKIRIVLSGIAWVLCSIVAWFTPHIILAIEYWRVL